MKLFLILSLITSCISYAQSNLPPCNGNFSGPCFGSQELTDGEKYEGQFKDGSFNGQGTFTFADGRTYVGQWKDDKRNGQGTLTHAGGDKYVGQWKDNQRNGQGTFTFADGDKYVGQFKDGLRNGQGTYTFANGTKYVGQFIDGKYDGFGTFYNANGSIFQQGLWRDDNFVQAQTPPTVTPPVIPKPPVNNAQDIKRQKCIRLGLVPGSPDFQQCIFNYEKTTPNLCRSFN